LRAHLPPPVATPPRGAAVLHVDEAGNLGPAHATGGPAAARAGRALPGGYLASRATLKDPRLRCRTDAAAYHNRSRLFSAPDVWRRGEYIRQAGLIPVAYTRGTRFSPARRAPLDTMVHWETW
jgi:hypothetical protein